MYCVVAIKPLALGELLGSDGATGNFTFNLGVVNLAVLSGGGRVVSRASSVGWEFTSWHACNVPEVAKSSEFNGTASPCPPDQPVAPQFSVEHRDRFISLLVFAVCAATVTPAWVVRVLHRAGQIDRMFGDEVVRGCIQWVGAV